MGGGGTSDANCVVWFVVSKVASNGDEMRLEGGGGGVGQRSKREDTCAHVLCDLDNVLAQAKVPELDGCWSKVRVVPEDGIRPHHRHKQTNVGTTHRGESTNQLCGQDEAP